MFVQNLHNLELVVDLDILDCVIKCAWLHVLSYRLYNLRLQHIENETDSHFETKIHNKFEANASLKKWNQTTWIEVYEGFGFTTSKGLTCAIPLVCPGLKHKKVSSNDIVWFQ